MSLTFDLFGALHSLQFYGYDILPFCMLRNIILLLLSAGVFFLKINSFKKIFNEHYQSIKRFGSKVVDPDLGQNCLQLLSAAQKIKLNSFCCFWLVVGWLVLLLYVPSQQLWSLRDGQFT